MGTTILHATFVLIFLAWFALSALNQFQFRWYERVTSYDYCSLIPYWSFFAPNPGVTDYHLVFRDRLVDGTTTPWREADLTGRRPWTTCVWNPTKRTKKVLGDLASSIARMVQLEPALAESMMISFQYLLILSYLEKLDAGAPGLQRQFAIVETAGFFRDGSPRVVLRSDFHALAGPASPAHRGEVAA